MKTKEGPNAFKEEVEPLNKKLHELTEEELAQVSGGLDPVFDYRPDIKPVVCKPVVIEPVVIEPVVTEPVVTEPVVIETAGSGGLVPDISHSGIEPVVFDFAPADDSTKVIRHNE